MEIAYGWASDSTSESWHITGKTIESALREATEDEESMRAAESDTATTVAWLCRAHLLKFDEILTDSMVETLLEQLDEHAGEVSGIQDTLLKNVVGAEWHERVAMTKNYFSNALHLVWSKALWYHEVDKVAPLLVRYSALLDAGLNTGDWVRSKGEWLPFSGLEKSPTDGKVMLGLARGYREVSVDQKHWCARVGQWSRFGAV